MYLGSRWRPWRGARTEVCEVWKFDSITQIGGHEATAEGHPRVIATPAGKAVEFGGVADALFLDVHPLAGAETFTWEVIFRPDVGGAAEQRFFHFQENGTETRMLFEIRVRDGQWCLDSFALSGTRIEGAAGLREAALAGRVASRGGGVRRHGNTATTWTANSRDRRNCTSRRRARAGLR